MTGIILDSDPGIDDAVAILLALAAREINVLAITTVAGNTLIERTFENARNIVALAGRSHVPVYRGAASPLDRPEPRRNLVHGRDGLGGVRLKKSRAPRHAKPAALSILDILEREPKASVTIVAVGPLTNLALALAISPDVFCRARGVAIMGGAVNVAGNVTPVAEFNFWADPLAADRVLQSGVEIDLFGLDVTTQAVCTPQWLDALGELPGPAPKVLAQMIGRYARTDPMLHDPCPVAWLMAPHLFQSHGMHVRLDTSAGYNFGKSVGWAPQRSDCPGPVNARVHTHLDRDGLLSLILERLQALA